MGTAFAKMTGITDVSSLRRASTMVPDWMSHLAPTAETRVAMVGHVETDLIVCGGNKHSGFVVFLLVSAALLSRPSAETLATQVLCKQTVALMLNTYTFLGKPIP